jgi:metal-sulfur cluster biosynthetic enzyme
MKNLTVFFSKILRIIIKKIKKFLQKILELLTNVSDFELNVSVGVQFG